MPNFLDQDGTVQLVSEIKDLVDEELHTYLRPNLLDNWYFVGGGSQLGYGIFPINQRGLTSYSGNVYGIDRWRCVDGSLTVNANYLSTNAIIQFISAASALVGETLTFTALLDNNMLVSGTNVLSSLNDNIYFASDPVKLRWSSYWQAFQCYVDSGTFNIKAIKLELGSTQTLAHNEGTDEEPVWVLNEIPNYEEQLIRCRTSQADSNDSYANIPIQYTPITLSGTASQFASANAYAENGIVYYQFSIKPNSGGWMNDLTSGLPSKYRPRHIVNLALMLTSSADIQRGVAASINDSGEINMVIESAFSYNISFQACWPMRAM